MQSTSNTSYNFTIIDVPDANLTSVNAGANRPINDDGQVAGSYIDSSGHEHGFVYDNGAYTTLDVPNAASTNAVSINRYGEITGSYLDRFGNYRSYVYDNDAFTIIAPPGGGTTLASGINDQGEVAGSYLSGYSHGFVYDKGAYTTLNMPGAYATEAYGINDQGEVVGEYHTLDTVSFLHGFVYDNGAYTSLDPPGALRTTAIAINDLGEVVGSYDDPAISRTRGFIYDNGVYTSLDPPGTSYTRPDAINDQGEVAGYYIDSSDHVHGFVYDNGSFTTIDAPGETGGTYVYGINNSGEIVGTYYDGSGAHSFIAREAGNPPTNNPPTITSNGGAATASVSIAENVTSVTTVNAQDSDAGQSLTFGLDDGDDGTKFAIGAGDGKLAFLTAPDFEAPTDTNLDGLNTYHVNVKVSDEAGGTDTQAITVAVTNVVGETWVGGNGGQTHTGTVEEDHLTGGNGKDVINGSAGNDVVDGGNGPDMFAFAANFGKDIITDFKPKLDTIQFDRAVFTNSSAVLDKTANVGGNAVITYDSNNTVTLQGVTRTQLGDGDFRFV